MIQLITLCDTFLLEVKLDPISLEVCENLSHGNWACKEFYSLSITYIYCQHVSSPFYSKRLIYALKVNELVNALKSLKTDFGFEILGLSELVFRVTIPILSLN